VTAAKTSPFSAPLCSAGPQRRSTANGEDFAPAYQELTAKIESLREAPTIQTSRQASLHTAPVPPRLACHASCETPASNDQFGSNASGGLVGGMVAASSHEDKRDS